MTLKSVLQFTFYVFAVSPRGTASDFRFTNFHFLNYSLSNIKHFEFQKEMGIINLRKEKNTHLSFRIGVNNDYLLRF